MEPRLFDVNGAAEYLSVSAWTVRDWTAAGLLRPVDLPARPVRPGARPRASFRRLLFDRLELDRFVDDRTQPVRGHSLGTAGRTGGKNG